MHENNRWEGGGELSSQTSPAQALLDHMLNQFHGFIAEALSFDCKETQWWQLHCEVARRGKETGHFGGNGSHVEHHELAEC